MNNNAGPPHCCYCIYALNFFLDMYPWPSYVVQSGGRNYYHLHEPFLLSWCTSACELVLLNESQCSIIKGKCTNLFCLPIERRISAYWGTLERENFGRLNFLQTFHSFFGRISSKFFFFTPQTLIIQFFRLFILGKNSFNFFATFV